MSDVIKTIPLRYTIERYDKLKELKSHFKNTWEDFVYNVLTQALKPEEIKEAEDEPEIN